MRWGSWLLAIALLLMPALASAQQVSASGAAESTRFALPPAFAATPQDPVDPATARPQDPTPDHNPLDDLLSQLPLHALLATIESNRHLHGFVIAPQLGGGGFAVKLTRTWKN